MTDKQLEQMIDSDLEFTFCLNLHELKNMINYNLKTDKHESDAVFWKFIGNPFYRIHEKSIAEKCRDSDEYRKKLFEKMDILINELSGGKKTIQKT